jgi:hypothetical protein
MGSFLLTVPDIPDSQLMFDQDQTREILRVFWPSQASRINSMEITADARRLAQTALVAAIDGSNQMGYVETLFRTAYKPNPKVSEIIKALAKNFVASWWRHTKPQNLQNAHLYEAVVNAIANSLRSQFDMIALGMQGMKSAPRIVRVMQA